MRPLLVLAAGLALAASAASAAPASNVCNLLTPRVVKEYLPGAKPYAGGAPREAGGSTCVYTRRRLSPNHALEEKVTLYTYGGINASKKLGSPDHVFATTIKPLLHRPIRGWSARWVSDIGAGAVVLLTTRPAAGGGLGCKIHWLGAKLFYSLSVEGYGGSGASLKRGCLALARTIARHT